MTKTCATCRHYRPDPNFPQPWDAHPCAAVGTRNLLGSAEAYIDTLSEPEDVVLRTLPTFGCALHEERKNER